MLLLLFMILLTVNFSSCRETKADASNLMPQKSCQQESTYAEKNNAPCLHNESLLACKSEGYEASCPPGLICDDDGHCNCADSYPLNYFFHCNGTGSTLLASYCATFDESRDLLVIGSCPFHKVDDYFPLPRHVQNLTVHMCKFYSRTASLCGRCLPYYSLLAYSYNLTCVPCQNITLNWFKYIAAAYLPLTIFYFIILFFKVNLVSAQLFGVIYCSQTLAMPVVVRLLMTFVTEKESTILLVLVKLVTSFYGIWNLDFFRPFYSELCLGLGLLPTLALDYVIAVYPLLLILATYLLIVLYDKNCRVVTVMWKPFHILFCFFRKKWDIRTSVIDAFATFFFLSSVKFLSVSFDLLIPTHVYQYHGKDFNVTLNLYYSGDIEYFGREHLPYGVLAIVMMLVSFVFPVLLLALYPFAFFQKFLNLFPVRWHVLHTFMDSFLGCYKNGMEPGTRDCRWFASAFMIFRLFLFVLYSVTFARAFVPTAELFVLLLAVLVILVQPFRSPFAKYNGITSSLLLFLVMFFLSLNERSVFLKFHFNSIFVYSIILVFGMVPLLYTIAIVSHWVFTHRKFGYHFLSKIRARNKGYIPMPQEDISESARCSLQSFSC